MDLQIEKIKIEAKPGAFIKSFIEEAYRIIRVTRCPVILKRGDIEIEVNNGLTAWLIFEKFMNELDKKRKEAYDVKE